MTNKKGHHHHGDILLLIKTLFFDCYL